MPRIIPVVLALAVTIYAVIDCARTAKESLPARLPKALWLVVIVLMAPLGGIVWIVVSRVSRAESSGSFKPTLWSSPDVSPEFERFRRKSAQEKLQEEIAAAPDNDPEFLFRLEREIQREKQSREKQHSEADGEGETGQNPDHPTGHPTDSEQTPGDEDENPGSVTP